MKSKIWVVVCFSLFVLSGCSGKNGLAGLGGNASTTDFGDITESSIEYFTENVGDTILR